MTTDPTEAIRLIQSGLDSLGHTPGAIDGQWGRHTARPQRLPTMKPGEFLTTTFES